MDLSEAAVKVACSARTMAEQMVVTMVSEMVGYSAAGLVVLLDDS